MSALYARYITRYKFSTINVSVDGITNKKLDGIVENTSRKF